MHFGFVEKAVVGDFSPEKEVFLNAEAWNQ